MAETVPEAAVAPAQAHAPGAAADEAAGAGALTPGPEHADRALLHGAVAAGVGALVIRVAVVLAHGVTLGATSDAADYQRLAVSLATGHGWGLSHYAPGGGPTAFRAPLYPLFLSAIYKVLGIHPTLGRLGGAVLGSLAVVLLVALTAMLAGRRTAIVAGALAAVFPPLVMASTALMSEALAVPLELACLCCAVGYRRSRRIHWAVLAGVTLGAAVLTRPNLAVLVVPVAALVLARPLRWRPVWAAALVVVAGTVVVTPWLVRDRLAFHQWVPLTTQSGVVVAGTYNATSAHYPGDPATWIPYPWDRTDAALMGHHRHAGEVETSSVLQSAADRYLRAHPAYAAEVLYQNTRHLFDLVPPSQTRANVAFSYGVPPSWGDADIVAIAAVLLLALAGILPSRRRRIPVAYWSAPVLLWLTTAVLQGMPRLRAAIDPFLLQLAAITLVTGWETVRRRRLVAGMRARPA